MANKSNGLGTLEKQQKLREAIQSTLHVKNLNLQALDEREMSDKAIQAAKILLAKTLPDLKQVEHSGDLELTHKIRGWKRI